MPRLRDDDTTDSGGLSRSGGPAVDLNSWRVSLGRGPHAVACPPGAGKSTSPWPGQGLSEIPPLNQIPVLARTLREEWEADPSRHLPIEDVLDRLQITFQPCGLGAADGGPQGLLTFTPHGGFRIEVDPVPPDGWRHLPEHLRADLCRHRTRFVATHELAHTLFYQAGPGGLTRLIPDSAELERFCDALAAELLVPREAALGLPLRPESVLALHKQFDSSIELAARALIDAHDHSVGWLVVIPDAPGEPWVQWGATKATDTVGPWRVLTTLAAKARASREPAQARLRWRAGGTTLARALFLPDRGQLVVTANGARA